MNPNALDELLDWIAFFFVGGNSWIHRWADRRVIEWTKRYD